MILTLDMFDFVVFFFGLFYHDLIMGNNVFSMGKGEFTTKHGCVVGCNSDVIGRQ